MNRWIVEAIQMHLEAEKQPNPVEVEDRLSDAAGG